MEEMGAEPQMWSGPTFCGGGKNTMMALFSPCWLSRNSTGE